MTDYANRGMGLESLINYTNEVYKAKRWALVEKKPTPVKISNVSARGRVEGYIRKSTVDYYGTFRGRSLDIEAKSTKEDRLPLSHVQPQQVAHMRECIHHGAITFFLVEFVQHWQVFYVPASMVIEGWSEVNPISDVPGRL